MKAQACQPCAKRKVRCDREEPCSNCKRRKQDQCIYTEVSPAERIKQLESLVSSLTGGTNSTNEDHHVQAKAATTETRVQPPPQNNNNSILVKENGESIYLESSSWHTWTGKDLEFEAIHPRDPGHPRAPVLSNTGSGALHSIICKEPYVDVASKHLVSQDAIKLWDIFSRRVHPVGKMSFNWEIEKIRARAIDPSELSDFTFQEHAFVFAIYLISVKSLSEDETSTMLQQSRVNLLVELQMLCEQALAGSNFFCTSDLMTIEALIMYITAGMDRIETRGLWSLMSVVMRNAERCGLHRDGSLLGLLPYETERRRRIWWQLQHVDLALGVRSGSIPLTLSAQWDTRLPLNIEDEDIDEHMREVPKEREGLTNMSLCLWTYWVLEEQRSFCRADGTRLGFSWAADKSLSRAEKDGLIDRLESGLNKKYLQYCDPIKPRDVAVQLMARGFVCGMRRLTLHPLAYNGKLSEFSGSHRNKLLDVCMQALEYDTALHSNPSIKHFRWRFEGFMQWSALVFVLIEARRQFGTPKAERIWELLSSIYAANQGLSKLSEDRRKPYAAELLIVAWKAREKFLVQCQTDTNHPPQRPDFLSELERRLSKEKVADDLERPSKRKLDEADATDCRSVKKPDLAAGMQDHNSSLNDMTFSQIDLDPAADFDFDAIDWSFWEAP